MPSPTQASTNLPGTVMSHGNTHETHLYLISLHEPDMWDPKNVSEEDTDKNTVNDGCIIEPTKYWISRILFSWQHNRLVFSWPWNPLCPSVQYFGTQHRAHGRRRRGANRWEAHSSEAEQSELSVDGPKSRLNVWSTCTAAFYCMKSFTYSSLKPCSHLDTTRHMLINLQIPKSHIRAQNHDACPPTVFTCIKSNTNITRLL